MKILAVLQSYPPERFIGAELYDHALIKKILEDEENIVDIVTEDEESWSYDGVEVNREQLEKKYDIILTHIDYRQKAYWWQRKLNLTKSSKIVGIMHNDSERTINYALDFFWDGIILNSEYLGKRPYKATTKTVLIPPCPAPVTVKKSTKQFLTMQANTTFAKGGVKYLEEVAKTNPDSKVLAQLGGWGGQMRSDVNNVVEESHAPIDSKLWAKVETLILPSIKESWSMLASEAIAHGVPVVTFKDLPGVKENLKGAAVYVDRADGVQVWGAALKKAKSIPKKTLKEQAIANNTKHLEQLETTVEWLKLI